VWLIYGRNGLAFLRTFVIALKTGNARGANEMNRRGNWTVAMACLLISAGIVSAKVTVIEEAVSPALVNPSFEDVGDAPDRAAGWSRWGQWVNREDQWTPVRTGRCILGYHHWEVTDASSSGIYQDVAHTVKGAGYTFGIYANLDRAKNPTRDALSIELRLESIVNGQQQIIATKLYKVADFAPDQWEKLTVSGAPTNDSLRVLVIITPSPQNGTRGGAIRFDDAFLEPNS
jgi:hypothetical protein